MSEAPLCSEERGSGATQDDSFQTGGVMFKHWFVRSIVVIAVFAFAACASDKGPAEKAISAAEDAVNAAMAEGSKYVPDQAKSVQDSLRSLKDSFAKGDYKAVLAGAGDVTGKAKALTDAAAAKKADLEKMQAEMTKSWEDMQSGLPKVVDAIKSRVDILSQAKKLPAGLDKAAVDGAKSGLETINKTWTEAQDAFKSGNVADAVAKAKTVKTMAADIMTKLGMPVPDALKS
jgi:hypothetical protein